MTYSIIFKPSALKQLRKLDPEVKSIIFLAIESLATNPRPNGCKKLKGEDNLYRIRVANSFRVIYQISDESLIVTIVKVGNREDIYR
jgi:mRNA interferase RelE/StbE